MGLGDDGRLPLRPTVVEIDHHPVAGAAALVCARGVGEERGVVAVAALGVKDRQPGPPARIEAPWRDAPQAARRRFFPVLTVNVEHDRGTVGEPPTAGPRAPKRAWGRQTSWS